MSELRDSEVPPSVASGNDPVTAGREQMATDLARTVLESAARRLAEAIAEYDAALDRRAPLPELQVLDREVATATREHDDSRRDLVRRGGHASR